MQLASREERIKLLKVRMNVAFGEAFPLTPQHVIDEFCDAFFDSRFGKLQAHMQVVAKARSDTAMALISQHEEGLDGHSMAVRIKKPFEELIGLILAEKDKLLDQLTAEYNAQRPVLARAVHEAYLNKSGYDMAWKMRNMLPMASRPSHEAVIQASVQHQEAVDRLSEFDLKHREQFDEIQNGV